MLLLLLFSVLAMRNVRIALSRRLLGGLRLPPSHRRSRSRIRSLCLSFTNLPFHLLLVLESLEPSLGFIPSHPFMHSIHVFLHKIPPASITNTPMAAMPKEFLQQVFLMDPKPLSPSLFLDLPHAAWPCQADDPAKFDDLVLPCIS